MNPRLYRVILIDPAARTIEEAQNTCALDEIRRLVGVSGLDHFTLADHGDSWDYGWCDEYGLSREQPVHAFLFAHATDPIAGRCVLVGVRKAGGMTCDVRFPLNLLHQEISWLGPIVPKVTWVESDEELRSVVTFQRLS